MMQGSSPEYKDCTILVYYLLISIFLKKKFWSFGIPKREIKPTGDIFFKIRIFSRDVCGVVPTCWNLIAETRINDVPSEVSWDHFSHLIIYIENFQKIIYFQTAVERWFLTFGNKIFYKLRNNIHSISQLCTLHYDSSYI